MNFGIESYRPSVGAAEVFLSAGIGLRQNLLIMASVCTGDRVRKFSLDMIEPTDLWHRCALWDRVRQNHE